MSEKAINITSNQHLKSPLKTVSFFFVFLVLVVSTTVILSRHFANQTITNISDNGIYKLFQSKQLVNLMKHFESKQSKIVNLVGRKQDGVDFFIQNFLKIKIAQGFHIKFRKYEQNSSIQFHTHQYFIRVNEFFQKHFIKHQIPKHNYWIIFSQIPFGQNILQQLTKISQKYKDDKFLIVSQKPIAQSIKVLKYKKISSKKIQKFLSSIGLEEVIINIIAKYHNNDLNYINSIANSKDPKAAVIQQFNTQIQLIQNLLSNSTEKINTIFNQLCKKGTYKSKKDIISKNEILTYQNKQYFWNNITFIQAYRIIQNVQCIEQGILQQSQIQQKIKPQQPATQNKESVKNTKKQEKIVQKQTQKGEKVQPKKQPKPKTKNSETKQQKNKPKQNSQKKQVSKKKNKQENKK